MLKWKKHTFADVTVGLELLTDVLAGMSGKNRVIKYISSPTTANLFIRVYRDAEQIADFRCAHLTSLMPLLLMELPLSAGQLCKAGFYMSSGTATTPTIGIGYEESE